MTEQSGEVLTDERAAKLILEAVARHCGYASLEDVSVSEYEIAIAKAAYARGRQEAPPTPEQAGPSGEALTDGPPEGGLTPGEWHDYLQQRRDFAEPASEDNEAFDYWTTKAMFRSWCEAKKYDPECGELFDAFSGGMETAATALASPGAMAEPTDAYWLSIRAGVIDALAAEGLEIVSNKDRVWLKRSPGAMAAEKWPLVWAAYVRLSKLTQHQTEELANCTKRIHAQREEINRLTSPGAMEGAQAAQPEPVAWMWQHAETGMTGFVEHASPEELAHFERMNKPRKIVAPLYAHPPTGEPT